MAYDIVNGLKKAGKDLLLKQLEKGVAFKEKLKSKKHQVFRLSFECKIMSESRNG